MLAGAGRLSATRTRRRARAWPSLTLPNATVTIAQPVAAGAVRRTRRPSRPRQRDRRSAGVLPRGGDAEAVERFRHQDRSLAARTANWNGKFQAVGNGAWTGAIGYAAMADALRRGYATSSTDTGPRRRQRELRARPSRKADRLRVSLRARDDRQGQGRRQRVLRQRAEVLVLERLLGGWTSGAQGSPDVSRPTSTASSPARRASTGRDARRRPSGSRRRCRRKTRA